MLKLSLSLFRDGPEALPELTLIREKMEIEEEDDSFILVKQGKKLVGYRKDDLFILAREGKRILAYRKSIPVEPDSQMDSDGIDCQCGCDCQFGCELNGVEAENSKNCDSLSSVSRRAWKKFMMCCVAVVEDARQIHAVTPMQGPHANLLNTQPGLPPWRLDTHTDAGKLINITVQQLSSGLRPEDVVKIFLEKDRQAGCPTRNPWQLVQNCPTNNQAGLGIAQYIPMNQPLPANHAQANNLQWRQEHHRTSFNVMRQVNNRLFHQPAIPESRQMFDTIKEWLNAWSDPECPRLAHSFHLRQMVDPANLGEYKARFY